MGCSIVVNLMLGGRTSYVNGQNQIVQSGHYRYLSVRVLPTDEKKSHRNIMMTPIPKI